MQRLFGTTVAMTGMNVDMLRRLGYEDEYEYVDGHASQHVSWYPGASPIHLRLVYRKRDGLILGATAIGQNDAARRIDVIAALMGKGGTVFDLEEAELCYSPQEGTAKDAVNQIGMAAANNLRGLHPIAHVEDIGTAGTFLLDVREEAARYQPNNQRKTTNPATHMRSITTFDIQYAHRFYGFNGEHGHTGVLTIEVEDSVNMGVNTASEEYEPQLNIDRCPLCGITMVNGVCPKCGYRH